MGQKIDVNLTTAPHDAAFVTPDGEQPVSSLPGPNSGPIPSGRNSPETQVFPGSPGGFVTGPVYDFNDAFAAKLPSYHSGKSGLAVGQNALSPLVLPACPRGGGTNLAHDDLTLPAMPSADGQHDAGLNVSRAVSKSSFSGSEAAIQERMQSWSCRLPDAKTKLDAILADCPDPELRSDVIATALATCSYDLSKFVGLTTSEQYQFIVENIVTPLLSDKCCCIEAKAWYAAPLDAVRRADRLELFTLLAQHGATATANDIKYCLKKPRVDHLEIIRNFIVAGKTDVNNCDGYSILGLVINNWIFRKDTAEGLCNIIEYLVEEQHADPSRPNADGDVYCAVDSVLEYADYPSTKGEHYTKAALYLLPKLNQDDLKLVCSKHTIKQVGILQCIIRNGVIPDFSCLLHLTDSSSLMYTTQSFTPELFKEFVARGVHACNASEKERKNFTRKLLSNISDAVVGKVRELELDKTQKALAVLDYVCKNYQEIGCIDVEKYLAELTAPMRTLVDRVDAIKKTFLAANTP